MQDNQIADLQLYWMFNENTTNLMFMNAMNDGLDADKSSEIALILSYGFYKRYIN